MRGREDAARGAALIVSVDIDCALLDLLSPVVVTVVSRGAFFLLLLLFVVFLAGLCRFLDVSLACIGHLRLCARELAEGRVDVTQQVRTKTTKSSGGGGGTAT